jgi:hypothetical protein
MSDFIKANEKVHKVEDQWHFPVLTKYGYISETKERVGFVRSYVYVSEKGNTVTCTTGVNCDYWKSSNGERGYHSSLELYLKRIQPPKMDTAPEDGSQYGMNK